MLPVSKKSQLAAAGTGQSMLVMTAGQKSVKYYLQRLLTEIICSWPAYEFHKYGDSKQAASSSALKHQTARRTS